MSEYGAEAAQEGARKAVEEFLGGNGWFYVKEAVEAAVAQWMQHEREAILSAIREGSRR